MLAVMRSPVATAPALQIRRRSRAATACYQAGGGPRPAAHPCICQNVRNP